MRLSIITIPLAAVALTALPTAAQEPPRVSPPAVGDVAPDFAIPGATRYGLLKDPVRLSDFRGETVVLAFFFRARTRG
jgi:peroxiredoxin Q/BCP